MDNNFENKFNNENYEDYKKIDDRYNIFYLEAMFYSVIFISFGYNIYKICMPSFDKCKRYLQMKKLNTYKLESDLLDDCSICLNNLLENQRVIKLKCNHLYHKDCISNWLKKDNENTCPLCRNNI